MDIRAIILIAVLSAIVNGQPIAVSDDDNQNFIRIPGVFISNQELKDLQNKAQQNQIDGQNSNLPITNQGSQPITSNMLNNPDGNLNRNKLKIDTAYQSNSNPQNVPINSQSQPNVLPSQPIVAAQPIPINQPIIVPQNPPQVFTPQVLPNQQPNQAILIQQPNQGVYTQQPGYNQPTVLVNPQPGNQILMSPQPNQQVVLPNGQMAQIVGQPYTNVQPTLVATSNQVPYAQNQRAVNSVSNPGSTLYAMVPVNGPNNMPPPNTNMGNGNTYLVPVQQVPPTNQVYAVSG